MRNILAFLLATLTLASCKTTAEFCDEKCPEKIVEKITIHDSLYVDTVEIYIPGNTITLIDSVPCDDLIKQLEDAKTRIKIVVKDRILTAECECKAEKRKVAVTHMIRTITKDKLVINKSAPTKPKRTLWAWLGYWESWVCMGVILLLSGILFVKWLKKKGYRVGISTIFPFISITKIVG